MSTAKKLDLVSIDDYLAGELVSEIRHEYLGGTVYAMTGGRVLHNTIKDNTFAHLHSRLRGKACQPFDSDMKLRVRLRSHICFYYPDVSVVCDSNPPDSTFQDQPVVVVEVLSDSTRRIDEGEKKEAYLTIPTLQVYVLVEQSSPSVVVHRRTAAGFDRETYLGLDAVIPLPEIETELPLAELYADVQFPADE